MVHKAYKAISQILGQQVQTSGGNSMARRSQMEILIDILKAVAEGKEKPTHIMYRANLSWIRLKKQLNFLLNQELLLEISVDNGTIYKMTPKGKEVLEYFKRLEGELYNKKTKTLPTEVYAHYK